MKVTMFTPLPPARTGIAHYASMLLPALRQQVDVQAFDALPPSDPSSINLYHLGNNPHHGWIYEEALRTPGVVVLHDLVLHHLIVEMTLAQGDADAYAAALRASHGAAGEAWARGRAAGLHSEMGNFLLPASVEVAQRSRAVIVHNEWAAGRLRSFGVTTPIHVVPHPYEPQPDARAQREPVRARHALARDARTIGLFGFLTSAKRAEVVMAAFAQARAREPRLQLLVVGEPAPNIDVAALQAEGITFTGYVDDAGFAAYFAAVDRLVNLRYPSAGETSGTLIRAFEAGKPVAVSDYAQFAELPDDCVTKIAFGPNEVEQLAAFFTDELPDPAAAQARWLHEHASMERTVRGYLAALSPLAVTPSESEGPGRVGGAQAKATEAPGPGPSLPLGVTAGTLPLFPDVALLAATAEEIVIRNDGPATLRTRTYGQPGYRLIVKLFDGSREVDNRWLQLPGDLAPGQTASLPNPLRGHGTLALYHALEGIPMLEPEAFARAAV
jgi:glycosyltransferase involved in cell wall biosynthesis